MKNILKITTGLFATSLLAACSVSFNGTTEAEAGQYYSGYVYDGVTAQKIEGYDLKLTSSSNPDGKPLEAKVSKDGYYTVGPLKPGSDFIIEIKKDGYRDFTAIENGDWNLPGTDDGKYTDFVEAWLFPTTVVTPAFTIGLFSENVDLGRPTTGKARFFPVSGSDLDLANSIGSGSGDRWANDLDAHNKTVIVDVVDGVVTGEEGALVYGVTYNVVIYTVDGHQYDGFNYTPGIDGDTTIVLEEFDRTSLQLISTNIDNGQPSADGKLVLTFNRDVEFAPDYTEAYYRELLDDNFSIDTNDVDGDGDAFTLAINAADEDDELENGTKITIEGNTITLSWDGNSFDTVDDSDPIDPIYGVTWGNLGGILIRTVGEENQTYQLNDFVNTNQYVQAISTPL